MFRLFKGIFLILLTIFVTASFVSAQETFVVDDDGNSAITYPTLAAAVATAKTYPNGPHYIEIEEGSYSDAGLIIDNSIISIIGASGTDPANIIFQAGSYQAVDFMDVSGTIALTLSGFSVMDYSTALLGTGIDNIVVTDMIFGNNGVDDYVVAADEDGGAIILYDCDDGLFDNLHIFDGERGLRLRGNPDFSDGNTISNCLVENNEQYGIGIGWYGGSNNTIDGNTVSGSEDFGLHIRGPGTGNVISNNTVFDCLWEGITVSGPTGTIVSGNTVYGCASNAINPSGSNDHTGISFAGIDIEGSATSATIFDNNCYENGNGVVGFGLNVDGYWCSISDNCFWGHPGAQAIDNELGATSNLWANNYYGDMVSGATSYTLGSSWPTVDLSPAMSMNNPETTTPTVEVWDNVMVDFDYSHASACDTIDEVELALYDFTVTWNPLLLDYVSGNNAEFLGPAGDALYVVSGDPSTGSITFSGTNFTTPNSGEGIMASIEFQAIGTGAATVTVGSTYRDANNVDIPVGSTPLVLTLQDTEAPTITVVANNPVGDDTYSDASGDPVQLFIEGAATDNFGLASAWYRFNDAGGWTMISALSGISDSYGGLPSSYYLDITGLAEGAHKVNVIALDLSGNRDSVYYNFNIDRTGPIVTSFALVDADGCANAEYTNDPTVTAMVVGDGTERGMEFALPSLPEGEITFAASSPYTLPSTDGLHLVYVRLYDDYGNEGAWLSETVTLDQVAPSPSMDFSLAGGALKTADTSITADISLFGPDSPYFMTSETSGDLTCGNAGWQSPPTHPFDVELTIGDGTKTVYFATKDLAGNVSAVQSDDIELDQTAPDFTAYAVTDALGGECETGWAVTVTFEWTDADVTYINFFSINPSDPNDTSFAAPVDISAETSPFTMTYSIPSGYRAPNASNTVFATLEDDIGNAGAVMWDDVFVDRTDPTLTSVLATDFDYTDGVTLAIQWSNSAEVNLEIVGLAADVVELQISETGAFAGEQVPFAVASPGDPFNMSFTFGTVTECAVHTVYVKALDCAGRSSGVVSDGITIDLTPPVITSFDLTSPDPTNVLSADFAQVLSDNCNSWRMQIFEDGFEGTGSGWIADAATYTGLILEDIGDGTRTIHLQLIDPAGNMVAASTTVEVDQTDPTGTFVVQQFGNPWAMAGFTNSLTDIEVVITSASADAVDMAIRNGDGSNNTGWISMASSYNPFTLVAGGCGTRTVEMLFRDGAGNYDPTWIPVTIEFRNPALCAPAASASASGVPGGSIDLSWDVVPEAQFYYLKYNFTGQYPVYVDSVPPHPGGISGDTLEGIFMVMESGVEFEFNAPHADIYAVSIWTVDMAGNLSVMPNTDVIETDYMLGDLDLDGTIEFVDDFGLFATTYSLSDVDGGFVPDADIGPTSDSSGAGYPIPDQVINVEDLAIMGMNYTSYSKTGNININRGTKLAVPEERKVIASVESIDETHFSITISANYYDDIMLYHLSFDAGADVKVVEAIPGKGFENTSESWFFHDATKSGVDLTGIVMGDDLFTDNELARIIIESNESIKSIENIDLMLRDHANNNIEVEFEVSMKLEILPTEFSLSQNYPNPFNPATTIELSLPYATSYTLNIYNITGQIVDVIKGEAGAGKVQIEWDAAQLSSGLYFYRVEAGEFSATKKMVLLK